MLSFKRATKEDYPSLASILKYAFANVFHTSKSVPPCIEQPQWLHERIASRRFWVIVQNDSPIGCLGVHIQSSTQAFIECIAILPEYQNNGFGSQALRWLESQYRNIRQWSIAPCTSHTALPRFFQRNGFFQASNTMPSSGTSTPTYIKDLDRTDDDPYAGCLFQNVRALGHDSEFFEDLVAIDNVRTERIISRGQSSPPSGFYDQDWTEIVLVVAGHASLEVEGKLYDLRSGDWRCILPHQKHRVLATSSEPPCVWYAIHITHNIH